jgi:hypothetical protein
MKHHMQVQVPFTVVEPLHDRSACTHTHTLTTIGVVVLAINVQSPKHPRSLQTACQQTG